MRKSERSQRRALEKTAGAKNPIMAARTNHASDCFKSDTGVIELPWLADIPWAHSPTSSPSGARMKSCEIGLSDRNPPSSIEPRTGTAPPAGHPSGPRPRSDSGSRRRLEPQRSGAYCATRRVHCKYADGSHPNAPEARPPLPGRPWDPYSAAGRASLAKISDISAPWVSRDFPCCPRACASWDRGATRESRCARPCISYPRSWIEHRR